MFLCTTRDYAPIAEVATEHSITICKWRSAETICIRRTFIQNEQLALSDNCSRQGKDLALANRQVATTTRNGGIKSDTAFVALILQREQSRSTQSIVQNRIIILSEGVQVLPQGTAEKLRLEEILSQHEAAKTGAITDHLRDNSNVGAESIKVDGVCRDAIVVDLALGEDQAQESQSQ